MNFYRVKQFFRAALDNFKGKPSEDLSIVKTYLNDELSTLFYKMNKMDTNHSLRVCRDVIREQKNIKNDEKLINSMAIAALLHDVGKSQCKSGIIHKVFFVLLEPAYKKGKVRWKTAINYYEHADISFTMLQEYNIDKKVLYLIKNHHNEDLIDSNLLLIRKCDDRN